MQTRRKTLQSLGLTVGGLALPGRLSAQEPWPTRDFRVICPFAAGSGADVMARYYARKLQEISGRTVIVENKVGAQGLIGSEYVARSKPDGYTIYIIPGSNVLASAPHLFKKISFDPINDFDHVATLASLPLLLIVSAKSPYRSVADLVADLKARTGKAAYASLSNTSLFCSELFKSNFGLDTLEVKFKDFATAINEMNSGSVSFTYLDAPQALGHIQENRIRALASTTAERTSALPNVPGAKESGMDMDIFFWRSVHVAKGTPRMVLQKLEDWFTTIAASDDHVKYLAESGISPLRGGSKELRELMIRDTARWAEYARIAKIEPQ